MNKYLFIFLIIFIFAGCSNPYREYYQGRIKDIETDDIKVGHSTSPREGRQKTKPGFILMGESEFSHTDQISEDDARNFGMEIGADLVILSSWHIGQEQGVVPIVTYNPGTTYNVNLNTSGNVNYIDKYNNNLGQGRYNETTSGTISTPSSYSTNYVNRTFYRSGYEALYFEKSKF